MNEGTVDDWREVELNQRPVVLGPNRVAAYAGPLGVMIRFLHTTGLNADKLFAGLPTMQLTNLATFELSPVIAKRLIVDLQNAVTQYEAVFGTVPDEPALIRAWNKVYGPKEPEPATPAARSQRRRKRKPRA